MATKKERRTFREEFKRQAVDRVVSSGLSINRVAEELGLHETVLRRWMKRFGVAAPGASRPAAAVPPVGLSPADLAAENARLKRGLRRAEVERDIPKKPRSSSERPPGECEVRVRR